MIWNGQHFVETSLLELGFVLHIGHDGAVCPAGSEWIPDGMPTAGSSKKHIIEHDTEGSEDGLLVIVDTAGVYEHRIRWCCCMGRADPDVLLFRMGLFSASKKDPKTAFTFRGLQYFHIDSMECRTAAATYFSKLRRLTNDRHPDIVPVCYRVVSLNPTPEIYFLQNRYEHLMRVSRQWRHLQDLKRFGYGHDKDKVPGDGDLADFCPACPQPGVNLPNEWHNLPDRFAIYSCK
jgi:hypothetical protein